MTRRSSRRSALLDTPTRILGLKHAAVDVEVGTRHACVRDDEGEVWCWGFRRALADDFDDLEPTPVHVAGSSNDAAVRVLVGSDLSCSFHADGHANCIGDGTRTFEVCGDVLCSDGTDVMPALTVNSVVDLVDWWGCHADARGGVSCFGHASYHPMDYVPSLGVYVSEAEAAWRIDAPVKGRVIDIGLGAKHGCALLEDGRVYCWGLNGDGQLGRAEPRRRSAASGDRALLVSGIPSLVSLDAGDAHTCGLDQQGTAWCWGANDRGQLGAPSSGRGAAISVPNMPPLRSLQVAELHACGLDHDGRVWCWGDDREGQLGDGPSIIGDGPRVVEGLPPIRQLAAAAGTTCAVDEDGEVWCWGRNKNRQPSTASAAWSLAAVEVAPSRIVAMVGKP
jgi:alpha-tubulin suppressor-like RCC1 family protein